VTSRRSLSPWPQDLTRDGEQHRGGPRFGLGHVANDPSHVTSIAPARTGRHGWRSRPSQRSIPTEPNLNVRGTVTLRSPYSRPVDHSFGGLAHSDRRAKVHLAHTVGPGPVETSRVFDPTDQPVRAGLFLVLITSAMVAATVWLLGVPLADQLRACLVAGGMVVAGAATSVALRDREHGAALCGYPLIVFSGLALLGVVNPLLGSAYTGFIMVSFIYVGLCMPPGWTLRLLLPATFIWLTANGVFSGATLPALEVKLPIALGLWACVGGLLARQTTLTLQSADTLRRQARLDPLTDLHNRRALPGIFALATGGDAVILIDLDHFKQINDEHGHAGGDRVLVEFAGVLADSVRDDDLVVRYGGEEFMLYLPNTTPKQADAVLHRIRERWRAGRPLTTFSAGIAHVTSADDVSRAVAAADECLYQAKQAGRDRWLQEPADNGQLAR
jgi:diguanylate cyclase